MRPQKNLEYRREARRNFAKERDAINATQTPKQRLEILDKRLGKGEGAVRERARLARLLNKQPAEAPAATDTAEERPQGTEDSDPKPKKKAKAKKSD